MKVPLNQPSIPAYYAPPKNNEIYLRERFKVLWQGKVWIIALTMLCSIIAVIYALTAQEWWSSKARIMEPQIQDYSSYQQQVKQFQPIFDIYQEDGTVLVSESLEALVNPKTLFQRFIDAYNSPANKKKFLDSSLEFKKIKTQLDTNTDEALHRLYSEWLTKITITPVDKNKNHDYDVSLQATTKESSVRLLNEYIDTVKRKVFNDALNNLQTIVNVKKNELKQQKIILEIETKNRLAMEVERSQYALAIAQAAGVSKPVQGLGDEELFAINLGSDALIAKVKALKAIKNLDVIEPRLNGINAKIEMLNSLTIDRSIQFQTFKTLENVQAPIARDKPKRALIVILGALLGGMLGVAVVLIRHTSRQYEKLNDVNSI
ncbi:LPS chain length-determining protein [Photobacterium frigidiphilum]|uniref:LPS chain length-determining protein n=1 Tax=Photobacterium frigidiphilum TaxID=264736 RepID=A0A2T3JPG9_9GAMM|nr:Wzz/FepE/Etk N-terminal domain-containing protein [Photobacterium frigidiphilum]PSU50900.1 LPS chain length-determining protein [Photobacterium frigidiphilum]